MIERKEEDSGGTCLVPSALKNFMEGGGGGRFKKEETFEAVGTIGSNMRKKKEVAKASLFIRSKEKGTFSKGAKKKTGKGEQIVRPHRGKSRA